MGRHERRRLGTIGSEPGLRRHDRSIGDELEPAEDHHPNDTVANVDPVQLRSSTTIAERVMFDLAGAGRTLDVAAE